MITSDRSFYIVPVKKGLKYTIMKIDLLLQTYTYLNELEKLSPLYKF